MCRGIRAPVFSRPFYVCFVIVVVVYAKQVISALTSSGQVTLVLAHTPRYNLDIVRYYDLKHF